MFFHLISEIDNSLCCGLCISCFESLIVLKKKTSGFEFFLTISPEEYTGERYFATNECWKVTVASLLEVRFIREKTVKPLLFLFFSSLLTKLSRGFLNKITLPYWDNVVRQWSC